MTTITKLKKGDRIVHQRYGVGEVVGVDTRTISGEPTKYYRVKTTDSLVWLAVDDIGSQPIRPVSKPEFFEETKAVLTQKPNTMSDDKNVRAKQIKEVEDCNDLTLIAEMMRDLQARKHEDLLLYEEKQSLKGFIARYATEWAASEHISIQSARDALTKVMAAS